MPKTKELSFSADSIKVEHLSKCLSVEVELSDVDELLSNIDQDDIKKYISRNYKPDEVFDESDLHDWAIDNDYTKS